MYCDMFTHLPSEMEYPKVLQLIQTCLIERRLAHTRDFHEQRLVRRECGNNLPYGAESRIAAKRHRLVDMLLEFLRIRIVENSLRASVHLENARTITHDSLWHRDHDFVLKLNYIVIGINIDSKALPIDGVVVSDEKTVNS